MKINKEILNKITTNARINLTDKEKKEFLTELNEIINYFLIIDQANTKDIEPYFQPIKLKNVVREDKTDKSLTTEQALSNTKHKKNNYFKGPKVQ